MKIFLDFVGCRLNQSEIEKMAWQFRQADCEIVTDPERADIAVLNTCAVTAAASSDSRQHIRQLARAGVKEIIVTGCWATMYPSDAQKLLVSELIPNSDKSGLVKKILVKYHLLQKGSQSKTCSSFSGQRTRSFIKIQDGCNHHCTYCITRIARGPSHSQTEGEIINDIQCSIKRGAKEVVLTGAQLGGWGKDMDPPSSLSYLIRRILHDTDINRLRLSSVEPWEINEDFRDILQNERFCPHLHLPLQSGSLDVLRCMARNFHPEKFALMVDWLRQVHPDIAITTDILVGFPGETEIEFLQTVDFVEKIHFARGHVFVFSPRPDTLAAQMEPRIDTLEAKHRSLIVRQILTESEREYHLRFKNKELTVLWEKCIPNGNGKFQCEGLTENYLRVHSTSARNMWNQFSKVRLQGDQNGFLWGTIHQGKLVID